MPLAAGNVSFTTWGFDNARTGVNPFETKVTPANIGNLKVNGSFVVDGCAQIRQPT
jgi:hypothetical protein